MSRKSLFYGTYNYGRPMYGEGKAYPYSGHQIGGESIRINDPSYKDNYQHDAYLKDLAPRLGYGRKRRHRQKGSGKRLLHMQGYGSGVKPVSNPVMRRHNLVLPGQIF